MIERLRPARVDEFEKLLLPLTNVTPAHLAHLTPARARSFWLHEIEQELGNQSATAWLVRHHSEVMAIALCRNAAWETKIIGEPIGTLQYFTRAGETRRLSDKLDELLDHVLSSAASSGLRCLTCKVQAQETAAIHSLERHGFLLMDSLLDFVFDFPSTPLLKENRPTLAKGIIIRRARPEDLSDAVAIAEKSFGNYFGRYHADPMITPEIATKFYRAWVESGFQGWAEFTLVAEVDRRIAGFGIWKKRSEREGELGVIHYSLAGINPDFAGRGLYSSLAAEGMQMAVTRGPHHLLGAVHVSNFAVHRALQKLGWKIRGARHSFHKWLQS